MSTLRDGYSSRSVTIVKRGWPSGESCFRSITFSPKWTGCLNWKACSAIPFTRSLARTFGKPATSKMYFSGYSAVSWPPTWSRLSIRRQEAPRIPA